MPAMIPKLFYMALLVIGITLLVVWTGYFLVPQGEIYDVGLWSSAFILILFGLVGYTLYGKLEKHELGEEE